jgi:hypothetical protein
VFVELDLVVLFIVFDEIEAGDVVLDLDLAGEVDELRVGRDTLVRREGMNSCFYSLMRY